MLPETNLEKVKEVACTLLYTDVHKTELSPVVVQHPFTSSGFVALTKNGEMQVLDITEKEEYEMEWEERMRKEINDCDNVHQIFMLTIAT